MWTSSEKSAALSSLFTIISCFLLLYIVTRVISSKNDFDTFMNAYLFGTYILVLYLLFYYGWSGLIDIMGEQKQRIAIDITQPNSVGQFTALSSLMAIYLGKKERQRRYFVIVVPLLFFLLASGSRGSFFAFAAGFVVLVFTGTRMKSKVVGLLIWASLFLFIVSQLSIFERIFDRFSSFFSFFTGEERMIDASTQVRFELMSNGLEMFKRNPVWGHGLNAFYYEYQQLVDFFSAPHNMYIYILVNHGLIGAFLWFLTPVMLLVRFIKQKSATKAFPLALLMTWLVFGISSDLVRDKNTYIILGFCIAYLGVYSFDNTNLLTYRRNE